MEGAPQVAGMSPLIVSQGKLVPIGGQRPTKKCGQYPHDKAREKVVLGRVTLSSRSYCPTQSPRFCSSSRCTVLPSWTSTKETRCPQINGERRCCTPTACQFPYVFGSSSARRGSRSNARSSCSSGLTRPLDTPHRRSCTTLQYVSAEISDLLPGCGFCAAAVALCAWPLPPFPIFEALQPCCDRVTTVSLYQPSSTNRSAQSTPPTHPFS